MSIDPCVTETCMNDHLTYIFWVGGGLEVGREGNYIG